MISLDKRIKWKFKQPINIPKNLKMFFWDEKKNVPLEKFILRILEYGNFEELKLLYSKFPSQCYDIIQRYPHIKRGVKYWLRSWHEGNH